MGWAWLEAAFYGVWVWHGLNDVVRLYPAEGTRQVTQADLEESSEEEMAKTAKRLGFRRQDSEAARIYN